MKSIDIVIPSFNEEGNIKSLYDRVLKLNLKKYKLRLLYVDDGSRDNTLFEIKKLSKNKKGIKVSYISFSRNFGHQVALKAGLDHSNADAVISMDADLQHPPELIPALIQKWEEGAEIVYTIRKDNENVSWFKRNTASMFYNILNYLSGLEISHGAADFRLLDKKVIFALRLFNEKNLFIRGLVTAIGFKKESVEYIPELRVWGVSKYSIKRMFLFALDGITSFSVKPLHFATYFGMVLSFFSGVYTIYAIVIYFSSDSVVSGWASVLTSVLFIGGMQLIILGIIGEYLGKLFIQSKGRPNYLISEKDL
ncbi:glycosyltransferase family 2 protein [Leptospira sp. 2 VSF19]|uniref:Glycosyltransferase family 2 protein n=1 Tax=Leptospira soteropolitanensis TaxID=2950025 RepID=A0AAW5VNN9_9LEPT|nr:glycosyltransferase family 2 protein [Leptospira soteropolitanensis]MCW7493187.1 glycosyltransferase family 2 protein [Leptospira soteropolitanensis]MCW7500744.1 glycosyltransferase family 2 protein [Leptospira soteropolitanensis]MCW7523037.1 glycosyltransferase family 2 protein [Leptospira soteropolitanensis]MCW7526856.1 glycosyltransferase family 2 protein [Leptospira soteropolitanensis]MCW7530755.1 glycosyltransferase family 2 protein [Leptospira soteropolitanensis]